MRWLALALVLPLLPLAPSALAQAPGATLAALDDPQGDSQGLAPTQAAGFVDLVRVEAEVLDGGLAFRATVADLSTDLASGLTWELDLWFEYADEPFLLAIVLHETTADLPPEVDRILWGDPYAILYRLDQADSPVDLADLAATMDVATRVANATIPWGAIFTSAGTSPAPGEPVRVTAATSYWNALVVGSPRQPVPFSITGVGASDEAVFPEGTFLTTAGSTGALSLSTAIPVRSSNGEATTFHWPVLVSNLVEQDLDLTFVLDAGGVEGRVPPGLRLAAGANATVNVYVTVPFNHEHGTMRLFPFTARAGPGEETTLKLGVDYPTVPQPAGHHPELWLHGSVEQVQGQDFNPGTPWMNTLEDDERANTDLIMPREENCPLGPDIDTGVPLVGPIEPPFDFGSYWSIALDPALAIGLDGRVGELASLDLELVGKAATPPGTLFGRLMLASEDFDGFGPFANHTDPFRASVAVPATPGPSSVALHLDLPMPPSLDLVAPSRTENLVLALMFCLDVPAPGGLAPAVAASFAGIAAHGPYAIRTGAHLVLVVDEYHDVIPITPSSQGLALTVDEAVRRAAPGATVLWRPTLSFPANGTGEHAVRLFGTGTPHANLLAPATVRGPNAAQLPVSFVVPDVPAGQVFDLLLDVTHVNDPARSVGLRLTVVVDPAATRDDAAQLASLPDASSQRSPPASLGIAVLALALLALRRRAQTR
ncbi:MAG: hypothetical protein AABY18_06740 [Candidatus Thermoplasmatota archaeon]|mgnify:CR=1 FL=1